MVLAGNLTRLAAALAGLAQALERFPIRWNIAGVGEVVGAFGGGEGVVRQSASTVRVAAARSSALSLAKASSIGFRSGL